MLHQLKGHCPGLRKDKKELWRRGRVGRTPLLTGMLTMETRSRRLTTRQRKKRKAMVRKRWRR